jgi:hypothetical protein
VTNIWRACGAVASVTFVIIPSVPLARVAWMTVAGICAVAALLLLVNGYDGYSAVLFFVGLSAAVNLLP